ncbi:hypothetical protein QCE63_32170 [Caballeronia sp. LZ065]|uniref:hypothetical protein n=1 Tax=Caballeronia sp. LZ065 TaxID=3038571 RepID=UPI00285677DD|nr:hypothetical protein [Caballeronia sp. LZ065]MDR5784078.1 hypothetical protein [Caballeronia sp. LZ065]
MLARRNAFDRECIHRVRAPVYSTQIRSPIVERVTIDVIGIARIAGVHAKHNPMHPDRAVLAVLDDVAHGIHVISSAVRLRLPLPLRQERDHVVIHKGEFVPPDSMPARQFDQSHMESQ